MQRLTEDERRRFCWGLRWHAVPGTLWCSCHLFFPGLCPERVPLHRHHLQCTQGHALSLKKHWPLTWLAVIQCRLIVTPWHISDYIQISMILEIWSVTFCYLPCVHLIGFLRLRYSVFDLALLPDLTFTPPSCMERCGCPPRNLLILRKRGSPHK